MAINAYNKNMGIETMGNGVHPEETPKEEKKIKDPAQEMWNEINQLPPKERLGKIIELAEKDIADTMESRESMEKKIASKEDSLPTMREQYENMGIEIANKEDSLQTMKEQHENMGKYIEKRQEKLETLKKELAEL